jgi:hypothetical protein
VLAGNRNDKASMETVDAASVNGSYFRKVQRRSETMRFCSVETVTPNSLDSRGIALR